MEITPVSPQCACAINLCNIFYRLNPSEELKKIQTDKEKLNDRIREQEKKISTLKKELSDAKTDLEKEQKEHNAFVKKMAATKAILEKLLQRDGATFSSAFDRNYASPVVKFEKFPDGKIASDKLQKWIEEVVQEGGARRGQSLCVHIVNAMNQKHGLDWHCFYGCAGAVYHYEEGEDNAGKFDLDGADYRVFRSKQ